ncbi:MAG: hypothetical protein PHO37_04890 [Kiritimatiellae bacterium]|nr:hypothetical protein [Kiritimatiellia bacterium]
MMDQGRFFIAGICAAAALLTSSAQENEPVAAKPAKPAAPVGSLGSPPEVKFEKLVRVVNIQGTCEVNNPDIGTFQPAKHNKAYPMGSIFRTGAGSRCVLVFSAEDNAAVEQNSELMVTACKENCQSLSIKLMSGTVKTTLRDNLADGTFFVRTPHTVAKNISGRGAYSLATEANNEVFRLSTITGAARIEGAHYTIPALQAANKLTITTAPDRSFTSLTSESGDFMIELPDGNEEPLVYSMSPKAVVKIWRENAPVGGRTIISTLVVSPTGVARHSFAYVEGRTILKTGELVEPAYEDGPDDDLPLLTNPGTTKDEPAAEPVVEPVDEPLF